MRMEVREMEIYRDPTVSKTELRVYGTMANHLQFTGDEVTVSRVELAKILGIHPSGVTKALKKLVDRGILLHGTKQRRAYRMNAEYAWKGSMEDRVKTVHKNRRAGGNVLTVVDGGVA